MEDAFTAHDKAVHDTSMNKNHVEKAKISYEKAVNACKEASENYERCLTEANVVKNSFYSNLDKLLETAKERNEKDHVEGTKNAMKLANDASYNTLMSESKRWSDSTVVVEAVNARIENDFLESFRKSCSKIEDFCFADTHEQFSQKIGIVATTLVTDEMLLTANGDPKETRKVAVERKKIAEKEIEEVEIIKASFDRIIQAAEENGDPVAQGAFTVTMIQHSKQIATRLENLSMKRYKLHCLINQIDGKPEPEFYIGNSGPKSPVLKKMSLDGSPQLAPKIGVTNEVEAHDPIINMYSTNFIASNNAPVAILNTKLPVIDDSNEKKVLEENLTPAIETVPSIHESDGGDQSKILKKSINLDASVDTEYEYGTPEANESAEI
jgi:hypothetical protein